MLAVSVCALGLNVGNTALPASKVARAPAVIMGMEATFLESRESLGKTLGTTLQTPALTEVVGKVVPTGNLGPPVTSSIKYFEATLYQSKGPLMASFAANMGDSTQITAGYKPRIVPAAPNSMFTSFVYGEPTTLGRSTPPVTW